MQNREKLRKFRKIDTFCLKKRQITLQNRKKVRKLKELTLSLLNHSSNTIDLQRHTINTSF